MGTAYLDFSKVFVNVSRKILTEKLMKHGLDGHTAKWLKNWLNRWAQRGWSVSQSLVRDQSLVEYTGSLYCIQNLFHFFVNVLDDG